jgi:hypothetical protein
MKIHAPAEAANPRNATILTLLKDFLFSPYQHYDYTK